MTRGGCYASYFKDLFRDKRFSNVIARVRATRCSNVRLARNVSFNFNFASHITAGARCVCNIHMPRLQRCFRHPSSRSSGTLTLETSAKFLRSFFTLSKRAIVIAQLIRGKKLEKKLREYVDQNVHFSLLHMRALCVDTYLREKAHTYALDNGKGKENESKIICGVTGDYVRLSSKPACAL